MKVGLINKKILIGITVGGLLTFSLTVFSKPNFVRVSAASLPTTINLNKVNEQDVRDYYSSISGLSSTERIGTNLLKNLKPILTDNFTYFSYDQVWKAYEITDRNWDLSPASSTTFGTYDSVNNQITGYQYYSTLSEKKNNPYVHLLYVDNNDDPTTALRIQDQHTASKTNKYAINREHTWPQSYGFKASSGASGPAGTDLHHLMAADQEVNEHAHSNYVYGNVDTNTDNWAETIVEMPRIANNKQGTALVTNPGDDYGKETYIFEPQDSDKGDIARALFYMCARYNNYAEAEGAISAFEPFLELGNTIYKGHESISSSDTIPATYGTLSVLLEWNKLDPPDEYEIYRNDLIYNNYQHNRNPFIDFPSWVDYVWGGQTSGADPLTDPLNTFEPDTRELTSIEIKKNPSKLEYFVGDSISLSGAQIEATFANGDKEDVTNKCTVTPTVISDKNSTTVTISYKHNDVTKTATYTITINEKEAPEQNPGVILIVIVSGVFIAVSTLISILTTGKKKHKKKRK